MRLFRISFLLAIVCCAFVLATNCSRIPITPDEPEQPPLPPIVEKKPPLKMQSQYFNTFPWDELDKPEKAGNVQDAYTYVMKDGETLETVAKEQMGDAGLAPGLATYNGVSPTLKATDDEKLVIPYPIIGMKCEILIKPKGADEVDPPKNFESELKEGDQFRFRFESNVSGYCYIFRETARSTSMLFPLTEKKANTGRGRRRAGASSPPERKSAEVKAHEPFEIPETEKKFIKYKPEMSGDRFWVFLSIRKITLLEELKEKKEIFKQDLEDVMQDVKQGEIFREPPIRLLRVARPFETLGFRMNMSTGSD